MQKLLAASSLGSADADYALASWFLHGHKVRRNLKKGITHLRTATYTSEFVTAIEMTHGIDATAINRRRTADDG